MRLLNTSTLKLEEYFRNIPPYAILSHVWDKEEVTFEDINKPDAADMPGYQKIVRCCAQARESGYEYCWIDTCCIDKRSSAELFEAINSMYNYYKEAQLCLAYLADVPSRHDPFAENSRFIRSRWFTRGWTLQELIASEHINFYGTKWRLIGTKEDLLEPIGRATLIHQDVLVDAACLERYSIAQKFSWLSCRTTTKVEDMAYCMLGIFDINMPLMYGEGQRAFIRLQEELVKRTTDQTFLCWDLDTMSKHFASGPFCCSPEGFRDCGDIRRIPNTEVASVVTNKGLQIQLPCRKSQSGGILVFPAVWPINGTHLALHLIERAGVYRRSHSTIEQIAHADVGRLVMKPIIIGESAWVEPGKIQKWHIPARLRLGKLVSSNGKLNIYRAIRGHIAPGKEYPTIDSSCHFDESAQYEFQYHEGLGLLIGDNVPQFYLTFGPFYGGEFWLNAESTTSIDLVTESLDESLRKLKDGKLMLPENGNMIKFHLDNGFKVVATRRKMMAQGVPFWSLEIRVAVEGDDMPISGSPWQLEYPIGAEQEERPRKKQKRKRR